MSEARAVADVLMENVERLTFLVNEAIDNASTVEIGDRFTEDDREFIQALRQAADILNMSEVPEQKVLRAEGK